MSTMTNDMTRRFDQQSGTWTQVPFCHAIVRDPISGERHTCRTRAIMTWHSVPFCVHHAPRRIPGLAGWNRL